MIEKLRRIYRDLFYIPKYGKMREKTYLAKTAVSVTLMLVCLFAMGITAYAYFSSDVYIPNNYIQTTEFDPEIIVDGITQQDDEIIIIYEKPSDATEDKEYTITVKFVEGKAETGFCTVTVNSGSVYHTQQVGADRTVDPETNRPELTFTLKFKSSAVITIAPHWGTSCHYDAYVEKGVDEELYIIDGETVEIDITKEKPTNTLTTTGDTGTSETTQPETTETTEPTPTTTESPYKADENGEYVIKSGDTLSKIAAANNTTVARICAYNGIADANKIVTGQKIIIPTDDWVIPTATEETTTDPTETTASEETTTPTETTAPEETTTPTDTTTPEETTTPEATATSTEATSEPDSTTSTGV